MFLMPCANSRAWCGAYEGTELREFLPPLCSAVALELRFVDLLDSFGRQSRKSPGYDVFNAVQFQVFPEFVRERAAVGCPEVVDETNDRQIAVVQSCSTCSKPTTLRCHTHCPQKLLRAFSSESGLENRIKAGEHPLGNRLLQVPRYPV